MPESIFRLFLRIKDPAFTAMPSALAIGFSDLTDVDCIKALCTIAHGWRKYTHYLDRPDCLFFQVVAANSTNLDFIDLPAAIWALW